MATGIPSKIYALTIFGYRKEGMDEKEYHDYVSQRHAPCLRELLAKNGIVDYTIVRFPHTHLRNNAHVGNNH
jgi:hypothetical protein